MRRLDLVHPVPGLPTASELHRARGCIAPWGLGLEEEADEPGKCAIEGRELHWWSEQAALCLLHEHPDPPANYAARLDFVQAMLTQDIRSAKPETWLVEQGIKWRPDGYGEEVERCERRPGARIPGWFSGTADLVYVRQDAVLVVADWKFGPREKWIGEPAEESCQGHFLALAFARLFEVSASSQNVVVARFERRMVSERGVEVDAFDITQGELDAFADWLRGLQKRILEGVGVVPEVSHFCGRCKAKLACPAWASLQDEVAERMAGYVGSVIAQGPPQSAEECGAIHHAITAGKGVLERWEKEREAYLILHPEGAPIGPGVAVRAVKSSRRKVVSTPEAMAIVEEICGPAALERKATLAGIEKAARDAAGEGLSSRSDRAKAKKAAVEDVFAHLAAAGAVVDAGETYSVRICRADGTEVDDE